MFMAALVEKGLRSWTVRPLMSKLLWITFVLQKLHVVTDLSAEKHTFLLKEWNYIQVSVSHCPRSFNLFQNEITWLHILVRCLMISYVSLAVWVTGLNTQWLFHWSFDRFQVNVCCRSDIEALVTQLEVEKRVLQYPLVIIWVSSCYKDTMSLTGAVNATFFLCRL